MLGEVTIGHMFIFGGDIPKVPEVKSGLLGADYKVENGRYRFAKISTVRIGTRSCGHPSRNQEWRSRSAIICWK